MRWRLVRDADGDMYLQAHQAGDSVWSTMVDFEGDVRAAYLMDFLICSKVTHTNSRPISDADASGLWMWARHQPLEGPNIPTKRKAAWKTRARKVWAKYEKGVDP